MDEYKTKTIELASFLVARGCPLKRIENDPQTHRLSQIGHFIFDDYLTCVSLEKAFKSDDVSTRMIDARKYAEAFRHVKYEVSIWKQS